MARHPDCSVRMPPLSKRSQVLLRDAKDLPGIISATLNSNLLTQGGLLEVILLGVQSAWNSETEVELGYR